MIKNRRLIIVIKAAIRAQANARAAELDREGGENTFNVPLSISGNLPATHYWCSWQLDDDWDRQLKEKLQQVVTNGNAWVFNGNNRTPDSILTELGLQRIEPQI
jgi:hypothetical protein